LGVEPFDSPYQYIAADANNSEHVSALDLIEIRKLILGVNIEFPNNTSWRFADAYYRFANPMHPWPFQESIFVDSLTQPFTGNFMAIKVGDLNESVVANLSGEQPGASKVIIRNNQDQINLEAKTKQFIAAGESFEIEFTLPKNMLGFQWTLDHSGLIYKGLRSESLTTDNIAIHNDQLTMSYARTTPAEPTTFILAFVAEQSGRLPEMIHVTSEITEAEGYLDKPVQSSSNSNIEIVDIGLDFVLSENEDVTNFALHQNAPNPFSKYSNIGFNLPNEMSAKITLYDLTGKIVQEISGDYHRGYNTVQVKKKDFKSSGIFYYTLQAGQYSATKKLIVLE
jgi:hypothetical protein